MFGRTALSLALGITLMAAGCAEAPERPNIVVVVLDAVRSDRVGAEVEGDGASLTPNVDRLAGEGTTFTSAWANAPWTLPSHVSLFTGLLPSSHGCTGAQFRYRSAEPTLAELLGEAGYETAAFYSNPWLSDDLSGMLRGFDSQHVDPDFGLSVLSSSRQGGPEAVAAIGEWLDEREPDRPLFMFVNLLEAHLPYDPPRRFRDAHLDDRPIDDSVTVEWAQRVNSRLIDPDSVDWGRVGMLYDGDVNTADSFLGEIVTLLEGHGLYDEAVVIVTSDHGENLGDHGLTDHQFGVYETLLSVPLVVRAPGRVPAGERGDPRMLVDIFPTVLEIAGVTDAPARTHARSLLGAPESDDRYLIAEYVVPGLLRDRMLALNPSLDEPWLYSAYATVRSGDVRLTVGSDGSVELHDLSRNPTERRHLEERGRALAEALEGVLPVPGSPSERPEIDEELRDALRSLGYVN